ncbi:HTH domain-containing protein [Pontiellaceae bacterium B1224]|nr:HTH domain-containing protein [Pontiellaceae bacterium B1224]
MSALDAAVRVLEQAGRPLHYREITKQALKSGLWSTAGKTPEATVNARLAVDIKRNGKASRFARYGRGVFGLNQDRADTATAMECRSEEEVLYIAKSGACSFTDAAERILDGARGQPMHYRDITRHALDHNLLNTQGKTPEATMYAQVLTETKRRKLRGEQPRFVMLGKGMVGLSRWEAQSVAYQVEQSNRKARTALLNKVKAMPPADFEELIGELLASIGFDEVEVTSRSKDGGIDVRGTLVVGDVIRTRLAVQVKRWKNNIQAPVIQQVRGSLGAHEQGLIITTSDFSKGACKEAERPDATPVGLMTGEQLVALLVENEIGVSRTPLNLIELVNDGGIYE